jgi:hypothetical protein
MSIFLFHVINLGRHSYVAADLLLLVCAPVVFLASFALQWLLPSRPYNDARAAKRRVYRRLSEGLDEVYRGLHESGGSDTALQFRLRAMYEYFMRNGRLIEVDDRRLVHQYIVVLRCLRCANRHIRRSVAAWQGTSQTSLPVPANARLVQDAARLRSALHQRVRDVLQTAEATVSHPSGTRR